MNADDFDIDNCYYCCAYNNTVASVRDAIYDMVRGEGIILDPCYTGKTFYAIRSMTLNNFKNAAIQSTDK